MLVLFTRALPEAHEPQFAVNADNVSWVMKTYGKDTTDIVTSDSLDVVTVLESFDVVFRELNEAMK